MRGSHKVYTRQYGHENYMYGYIHVHVHAPNVHVYMYICTVPFIVGYFCGVLIFTVNIQCKSQNFPPMKILFHVRVQAAATCAEALN